MEASADRISRWTFSSLLILSLLQQYDSQPTLTPVIGNKLYVTNGSSSFDLSWNYNTDGRTINEVDLKYVGTGNNDVTVAGSTPTTRLQVNPASGYSGRITFSGSLTANVGKITFRISNIVQSDSRIFRCDLSFTTFSPPNVQNSVELVVIAPSTSPVPSIITPSPAMPTPRPSPTRPRFAFTVSCFPSAMVAHIARDSLPLGSDPRLLHLNDPSCGVNYLTKKSVIIKAPLKGCGTVRRNIGYRVFFHNKVVVPFGYGNKRSLSVFPFKCVYSHFGFP